MQNKKHRLAGILLTALAANCLAETDSETPFRGASLASYDPLELPSFITTQPISPTQPPQAETAPARMAKGEINPPPPVPLTDNLGTNLALSMGVLLLSSSLDKGGDRFAQQHGKKPGISTIAKLGNALPFIAISAAGLAFLNESDPRMQRTGMAALQAGGVSALTGLGLKYTVARARPEENMGPTEFNGKDTRRGDSSFPSIHAATAWGIITPFAKEYDMPWLYGVAAITNLARITDRKHWVSDTVAGSLLGYWMGDMAWQHNRIDKGNNAQVFLSQRSLHFSWSFQ